MFRLEDANEVILPLASTLSMHSPAHGDDLRCFTQAVLSNDLSRSPFRIVPKPTGVLLLGVLCQVLHRSLVFDPRTGRFRNDDEDVVVSSRQIVPESGIRGEVPPAIVNSSPAHDTPVTREARKATEPQLLRIRSASPS
jgi:hypothetical protein